MLHIHDKPVLDEMLEAEDVENANLRRFLSGIITLCNVIYWFL